MNMARTEWRDTWKSQVPADVRVIPRHGHESGPHMDLFGIYRTRTFVRRRVEEVLTKYNRAKCRRVEDSRLSTHEPGISAALIVACVSIRGRSRQKGSRIPGENRPIYRFEHWMYGLPVYELLIVVVSIACDL